MVKPLCKFCGAHHDTGEEHPEAAVREALRKLRAGAEPELSGFAVGGWRESVTLPQERVTETREPEPVTKSVVTKPTVTKGRPRIEHPSAEALRRREYRERREAS